MTPAGGEAGCPASPDDDLLPFRPRRYASQNRLTLAAVPGVAGVRVWELCHRRSQLHPQSFLSEPASSASGTPPKAQPFAGIFRDVFDLHIIRAAALTAAAEVRAGPLAATPRPLTDGAFQISSDGHWRAHARFAGGGEGRLLQFLHPPCLPGRRRPFVVSCPHTIPRRSLVRTDDGLFRGSKGRGASS
jgi:hypothetical protein